MSSININNRFRLISWNVKGLGNATKLGRVMTHLNRLKGDIYFLQETHMPNKEVVRLKKHWVGEVFHSTFNCRARGAAIIFRKDLPFIAEKSVLDPNGRYVIVSMKIQLTSFLFICVYGPNWDDSAFVKKLFSSFPDLQNHYIIMGGDFNFVQDPQLDRSSNTSAPPTRAAKMLSTLSQQFGITDPWRHKFPGGKSFSFFSHVHRTFSRIDFFLLDVRLLSNLVSVDYHGIAISDHSPVSLDLAILSRPRLLNQWRFNAVLLAEESYKEFIQSQLTLFFEFNDLPETNRSNLWEASKAYIRGQLISFISNKRKVESARTNLLLNDIKDTDQLLAASFDPDLYKKRLALQTELDLISTTEVRTLLLKSRQRFYESGDKAGKLLSYQARAEASSRLIPAILSPAGVTITDPVSVNETFAKFYSTLYTSECPHSPDLALDKITFPRVTDEDAEILGKPITTAEVSEAIKSLQSGKAPGPDGFTTEYYKTFSSVLSPFLKDMYNEAFLSGCLPNTLSEATISLLLKKDKDPLLCSSYRPISLLNVDFKILSKILASRLQCVLSTIINLDQTGFMPGRLSSCNTRRLFNIISSPCSDWVKLLYSSPKASVRTNNTFSPSFSLHCGTRQGCPLSPLLFLLAIEPLAIWLRSEAAFIGIKRLGTVHKVSLYADDLLLYVSDPITSVPIILNILQEYSNISGYKLNYQKSEFLPINDLARMIPSSTFPFRWSPGGFRYLGIQVTPLLSGLYHTNFTPLIDRTERDFLRWSALPISLAGRVSLVKMAVLPRFLYLFQHLPIFLGKSFFDKLDRTVSSFLWSGRPARIRKSVLQAPKDEGGLALPVLRFYYWAANIQKLLFWMNDDNEAISSWTQLEGKSSEFCLRSILCAQLPLPSVHTCPVVSTSLKIWSQFRKHFGLINSTVLTSVYKNCRFDPSKTDLSFKLWHRNGIKSISDLYTNNVFSSFEQLSKKYALPNQHLFRFFQIRDYVKKLFPHFPNRPPETLLDVLLSKDPFVNGCISSVYKSIWTASSKPSNTVKTAWEDGLNLNITEQQWRSALSLVHLSSICARHRLIQCKIVYRVHYTNARLAKIYPSISDACSRCHLSPANHAHMFWSCPVIAALWTDVFDTLTRAYRYTVTPNPMSAIFGLPPTSDTPSALKRAVAFTTLLARRLVLLNWKLPRPPSHVRWVREVLYNLKLERLRYSLHGSLRVFHETWSPFLQYVDSLTFPHNLEAD
uniref:Reverse transcriptase domain-containing protein n=1 Tax=Oryzias latipes TaxID=8090 RepID=A0A3P9JW43_ORYLA